jgi:hypothetical protein
MSAFELTLFAKSDGPLTKQIRLDDVGAVKSDASCCFMARGSARRLPLTDVGALAETILSFQPQHAIALGGLRPDLPLEVEVTTKRKLNGATRPDLIARTADNLLYIPGQPALALFDYDTKGMPPETADRIRALGGFEAALATVLPGLVRAARLMRASTSAGLYRTDTGERLPGSSGMHLFAAVRDGTDIVRFLQTLHARCWLAGFGWLMVGAGGQLLERSIIDRVVGQPERLVFEGPPILFAPLAQDAAARQPVVFDGEALDTTATCPPLTILEAAAYREARSQAANGLAPEIAKARAVFVDSQAERLVARTSLSTATARRTVERQTQGVLLSDVALDFDDPELAGTTVADILADPERYVGETLADPLEGVDYGRGKAKVMRRADGTTWIHSFAHGRTTYELKPDYRAALALLEKAPVDDLATAFVQVALTADLDAAQIEQLRNLVHQRSGIGKRPLDMLLKEARGRQRAIEAEAARERHAAERRDHRPLLPVPPIDAEFLPQMATLNQVLGAAKALVPPLRDADRGCTEIRAISVPSLSHLSKEDVNQ